MTAFPYYRNTVYLNPFVRHILLRRLYILVYLESVVNHYLRIYGAYHLDKLFAVPLILALSGESV